MNNDILVLIEHVRGQVTDISYIMLAQARQLAPVTGGQVTAVLLGQGAQGLASGLAADKVIYVDHPALAEFTGEAYQRVLVDLIEKETPRLVLMGDTTIGSDVA
jgi:electron transfer flavoprotein alpha subunit